MLRDGRRLEHSRHRSTSLSPRYPRAPSDSLNRNFPPPPTPNIRWARDGFDYRRPVMSQPNADFIDLTIDLHENAEATERQRTSAPRPQQNVIEIEDGDHASDDSGDGIPNESSFDVGHMDGLSVDISSDAESDIELLYSRPRDRTQVTITNYARPQVNEQRERSDSPVIIQTNTRDEVPPAEQRAPRTNALTNILAGFAGRHRNIERNIRRAIGMDFDDFFNTDILDQQTRNFNRPELNFETVGFELQPNNQTQPPPPRPTYEAPPPPGDGFTRSPKEDDTVICPNCDHELGQGNDEIRRQIWVIRSCGHVSALDSSIGFD